MTFENKLERRSRDFGKRHREFIKAQHNRLTRPVNPAGLFGGPRIILGKSELALHPLYNPRERLRGLYLDQLCRTGRL